MTKTERGDEGIIKFRNAKGIGTFDYIMRFGKTELGLRIAKLMQDRRPEGIINIIVPSVAVKDIWLLTIIQKFVGLKVNVLTADYVLNNVKECMNLNLNLLIVDELHKFTSDERIKILNGSIFEAKFRLGLTGTYPYGNSIIEERFPVIDKITEEEALREKWISNFIEYNVRLDMTPDDKLKYLKYSKTIREVIESFKGTYKLIKLEDGTQIFKDDIDVIYSCYRGKDLRKFGHNYIKPTHVREALAMRMGWQTNLDLDLNYNKRIEEDWNPDTIKDRAFEFYNAVNKRNDIHNNNQVKLDVVTRLYDYYKDKTIITFNQSIDFADKITEIINDRYKEDKAISYHSKTKGKPLINFVDGKYFTKADDTIKNFGQKRQLAYIISMMGIGKYNMLNTVSALDDGLNIPNINLVITTSGTTNPMKYSQQSARGKTVDIYNPNKVTLIINLFFDDFTELIDDEIKFFKSRDKTKLLLRQANSTVPIVNISEIIKNN